MVRYGGIYLVDTVGGGGSTVTHWYSLFLSGLIRKSLPTCSAEERKQSRCPNTAFSSRILDERQDNPMCNVPPSKPFINVLSVKFLAGISQIQLMPWIGSSLTCDSSFICQEIPRILWNYKIHYPV